jgi:hypothetical protein
VWNRLKAKRLSFSLWQKSAQEYENKGCVSAVEWY